MVQFGTDGIRGRAGRSPCTAEVGLRVGRAAARLAARSGNPTVVICRDTRPSGPMLEAAVAAGVMAAGGCPRRGGVLPSAAVAEAVAAGMGGSGIMLTASHNPWQDNGFKLFGEGGSKPDDALAAELEGWIAEPAAPGEPGEPVEDSATVGRCYRRALRQAVGSVDALRGQRLAIDLAHGAASPLRDWLEDWLPCELVWVGAGGGRCNEGVGSEHPEALIAAVRERRCAAGFAVDGDGDRCRLVDERGRLLPGDGLAWLLARALDVDRLAVTVMSNGALEASLPGVEIQRTPVGDRHLAQAMRDGGPPLGCEASGHVLFADGLRSGDGLLTGLRALSAALGAGGLSAATAGFLPLPRVLDRVEIRRRPPLDSLPALVRAQEEQRPALGAGGRIFLRYSGTEPVLRVLVEGQDREVVAQVAERICGAAAGELA